MLCLIAFPLPFYLPHFSTRILFPSAHKTGKWSRMCFFFSSFFLLLLALYFVFSPCFNSTIKKWGIPSNYFIKLCPSGGNRVGTIIISAFYYFYNKWLDSLLNKLSECFADVPLRPKLTLHFLPNKSPKLSYQCIYSTAKKCPALWGMKGETQVCVAHNPPSEVVRCVWAVCVDTRRPILHPCVCHLEERLRWHSSLVQTLGSIISIARAGG